MKLVILTPILTSHTKGIVTIGKDLWFRDVFLFTDRLKDIAIISMYGRIEQLIYVALPLPGTKANGMVMIPCARPRPLI
jgi:uncharacterized membrane protein